VLPWQTPRYYPGAALPRLDPASVQALPAQSTQAQDLRRFQFFSDDWLIRHPDDPQVIGDLRYAGLPNGVRPLWGIRIDPTQPDRHVAFEAFRSFSAQERQTFLQMLRGAVLAEAD
jgi:inner membrane protein